MSMNCPAAKGLGQHSNVQQHENLGCLLDNNRRVAMDAVSVEQITARYVWFKLQVRYLTTVKDHPLTLQVVSKHDHRHHSHG